MFYLMATYIHKSTLLPCLPFKLVFGCSAVQPDDVNLITTYIHKSIMLPSVPFNVVSRRPAILTHDVLFDDQEHSQAYVGTMHAI